MVSIGCCCYLLTSYLKPLLKFENLTYLHLFTHLEYLHILWYYKGSGYQKNFVQTIWEKIEVLLGNNLGTWWEHWEQGEKRKKNHPPPPPPPKRKKIGPLMKASWAFSLAAWTSTSETGDNPPPPPHPKRKKLDPSWGHTEPSHWLHGLLFPKLFVTIFDSR
jgi:hypothetical protein